MIVRPATAADTSLLPEIERVAGLLYKTHPDDLGIPPAVFDNPTPVETFNAAWQAGRLWVAVAGPGTPIGFALVTELAGYAHLDELDVLPAHGRRGAGSLLLGTVCAWAVEKRYPAVTLRTFRDVPWNAPFYARHGFRVVQSAALSEQHVDLERAEQARGLRLDLRVTMVRELTP